MAPSTTDGSVVVTMQPHPPPLSSSSHDQQLGPSPLLVVVCLAIVHRLRPQWLAVTISEAAHAEQLNAERVSRLCSRAVPAFESALGALTRLGRPRRSAAQKAARGDGDRELLIARSLLSVATSILRHVPLRKPAVRSLILGAWLRLSAEHPYSLTQKEFCAALALSPRTLRSWRAAPPAAKTSAATHKPPPPPPRKRPPRRPRFSFDLLLPDTQLTADTTDLQALGIPLKLIATQDIGGRDQDLLDSVVVDDHESAEQVIAALRAAIDGREGFQVLVDQGTPYMAEATRAALEELGAEHAPQREGTPTDKATIERAFRSVKTYARPLLALSNRIAALIPQLRRPELAKALTTLVLTALLRAYQGGARATQRAEGARAGLDRLTLEQASHQVREDARLHDQSRRLRLQWIYQTYRFPGTTQTQFVKTFERFALPVIERAEQAFAAQAHRPDIVHRVAYFAKLARRFNDEHLAAQSARRRQQACDRKWQTEVERARAERIARHDDPLAGLRAALDILPAYWNSQRHCLLYDGIGPGRTGARTSIQRLTELHGDQAADIVTATLRDFANAKAAELEPAAIEAIDKLVRQFIPPATKAAPTPSCTTAFASTILRRNGQMQRPPPS